MIIRILAHTESRCILTGVAMTTLTTAPLSDVLKRLFAESAESEAAMHQAMSNLTPEERTAARSQSTADYQTFYMTRAKNLPGRVA
jgi:hypothetical protein